jgi:hypothetical protein
VGHLVAAVFLVHRVDSKKTFWGDALTRYEFLQTSVSTKIAPPSRAVK